MHIEVVHVASGINVNIEGARVGPKGMHMGLCVLKVYVCVS
jgi:hypothetical protein